METPKKGEYLGECNRSACDNPEARFYNKSTKKHYCAACAEMINRYNRADCMRLFGVPDLCELSKTI